MGYTFHIAQLFFILGRNASLTTKRIQYPLKKLTACSAHFAKIPGI